ncbi:MAG: hypothetical protein ABIX10_08535 [Acidimicrobiales bacterium]
MRSLRLAQLLVAAAVVVGAPPGVAAAGEPTGPRAERVLVLSLPALSWDELYRGDTPALDGLLDGSAVGALSVRDVLPVTDAGDGYATMSAGARARGVFAGGQVLEPSEDFLGTPAGAVFARNTGVAAEEGLLAFGFPSLVARNGGLDYGAEIGALGQSLAEAGVPRAVIANADGRGVIGGPLFNRTAATALIDERGVVPSGAVSTVLLEPAPSAPYGLRYARSAVVAAFEEAWEVGGVVLLEGSDLARADRYLPLATPEQRIAVRRDALRATDALVEDLLESVDVERDAVVVVAPYHAAASVHLTVASMRAPGIEPGLLRSASTRRSGLVTLVDIAPTILQLVDVDQPPSMEGRRFERSADGAPTGEGRAADLDQIDQASRYRDRMVAPVAITFVVLQALLWIGAAFVLRRQAPRLRRLVGLAALAMLAYLPATYLAGLFDFHAAPTAAYWAFMVALTALLSVLTSLVGRRSELDPLLLCLGLVFGLLVVDIVLGAPLQLNTVFGYSPTVGGRFAGLGNLAFGQFAGAAFLLYGLLSRRLAGRSSAAVAAFGVLLVAIVVDGMPFWGSDVGGVLAFVPAVGVTVARLHGHRIRWRSLALWGTVAVVVVGGFAAVDLTRPADRRTHLGRLVESVADQGFGALETVVSRKLGANLSVITSSVWTAMVPTALGFVVYLLWRAPGHVRSIRDTIQESLAGLAVVGFLGFALNDSGIAVPGVMLGVVNASLVYLTVRTLPSERAA